MGTDEKKYLIVGFGREDITAPDPIPMGGYGDPLQRLSRGVLLPLMASCIAITDPNGETVLFFTVDHLCTNQDWMEDLRNAVTGATDVPPNRILVSATHTHSGPDVRDTVGQDHPYYALFKNALVRAAVSAMDDRTAADIRFGSTTAENLNFVRHYIMSDGFMAGDNFGDTKNAVALKNHHKADSQVQLVRFVRQNKMDILMVNFQAHPKLSSTAASQYGRDNRYLQSSDIIGATRNYVEDHTPVLCACFQGAAGNLNPNEPYLQAPDKYKRKTLEAYGEALGRAIIEAIGNLQNTEAVPLLKTKQILFRTKHKRDGSPLTMELDAVALGEIGFVTAPYEMMDVSGKQIKDTSPFPATFVLTCANGRFGYVANWDVWNYQSADGRTAWEITLGLTEQGTAEKLVETFTSMLRDLAE